MLNEEGRVENSTKNTRLNFFYFVCLSPVQGSLKVFSTVEWGDRRFSNLGGVIEKHYRWGVSVLNGNYFCWKDGRSIHDMMIHYWSSQMFL